MKNTLMSLVCNKRNIIAAGVALVASPMVLIADVPNLFQDGDVIYAEDVNDNFGDLDERIDAFEAIITPAASGNVGIGISTPRVQLDLSGTQGGSGLDGFVRQYITNDHPGGGADLLTSNDGGKYLAIQMNGSEFPGDVAGIPYSNLAKVTTSADHMLIGTLLDSPISFMTSTIERMVIEGDGSVGIGTSTPRVLLDLHGNKGGSGLDGFVRQYITNDAPGGVADLLTSNDSGKYLAIQMNGSGLSGEVAGVPYRNLAKVTTSADNMLIGTLVEQSTLALMTGTVRRVFIGADGNVGIGTDSPASRLHVAGTITETSDARLKSDIEPVANALEKLMKIDGVTFNWIDDARGAGTQMGVIAQDVEIQFPELVRTDSRGFKSVNYSGFVAPLLEGMQAQQAQIESLEAEVEFLRSQLAEQTQLKTRLDRLEASLTNTVQ